MSHMELWNLRARVWKAREDTKDDRDYAATLGEFFDQFSEKVSLRRASQTKSFHHQSYVVTTEFILQPSSEFVPTLLWVHHTWSRWNYEDKGASEDCNKLNLESKPVMRIDDKGVTDTVGSTVIFLRGVQTENGCAPYSRWRAMKLLNDVFFFFSYVDVSVHC